MNLLIVTQKVDSEDAILGFFHRWIEEFAKHYKKIIVICLEEGKHSLPENVKVLSLGKEQGVSKFTYLKRFFQYIWRERKNYDTVFVHMNPEYVVLGGLLWRLLGKKIGLWYTHRQVNFKLWIAAIFSHIIFSASDFSFGLETSKLYVVGHGINVDEFSCLEKNKTSDIVEIISVGRITKIKNCDTLIRAAKILKETWNKRFKIIFAGSPGNDSDRKYAKYLKQLLSSYNLENNVTFAGSFSNKDIKELYCKADASVNMTPTGGIDKVVIESMAAELPVFASNEAFRKYFGQYAEILLFKEKNEDDLAKKIIHLFKSNNEEEIGVFLRKQAREHFEVQKLILNVAALL